MNERNIPQFTTEEIKNRLAKLECLTGKAIEFHPSNMDLIASVVMTLARQCNLVNDRPMK